MSETGLGLQLFQDSHERLLQQFLELERQKLPADVVDTQLMDLAETIVRDYNTSALIAGKARLTDEDERQFRANVRGIKGGGSLVPLLERSDVENIHILGHDTTILSLADGRRILGPPLANSEADLVMMIRHLAATAGHTSRRFDTASPILDLRLASGHRLFAITAVAEATSVVIRRHRMLQASLDRLLQSGTVTPPMVSVLRAAVRPPNPANLLVVGGTGAGKTTLLRSLLSEVPQDELIVTIEDTLELHLGSSGLHPRTLALETRTSNTEGTGEISMYDLCKAALRMSPDRVVVGEVRGGEVMQLLQSMGIGNDGSLGTIHAGSTRAAINKILIYAQRSPDAPTPDSVLREISEVMHLLVYIKKLPDGRRAITSIREIVGFEDGEVITSEVFAPGPDGVGVYVKPFEPGGEPLARLVSAGFDPKDLGEPYRPHVTASSEAASNAEDSSNGSEASERAAEVKPLKPSAGAAPAARPADSQPSARPPQPAHQPPSAQPAQSAPAARPQAPGAPTDRPSQAPGPEPVRPGRPAPPAHLPAAQPAAARPPQPSRPAAPPAPHYPQQPVRPTAPMPAAAPGHPQPGHHQPGHHQPGHHQPGHHQPGDSQPRQPVPASAMHPGPHQPQHQPPPAGSPNAPMHGSPNGPVAAAPAHATAAPGHPFPPANNGSVSAPVQPPPPAGWADAGGHGPVTEFPAAGTAVPQPYPVTYEYGNVPAPPAGAVEPMPMRRAE